MSCKVQSYDKNVHEPKNINKWWFKTYGDPQTENKTQEQSKALEEMVDESAENVGNNQNLSNLGEQIQETDEVNCPVCTAFNPVSNEYCEVCTSAMRWSFINNFVDDLTLSLSYKIILYYKKTGI